MTGGSEIYLSVPSATCALNYEGRRLQTYSPKLPYFPQPVTRSIAQVSKGARDNAEKSRQEKTPLDLSVRVKVEKIMCLHV